MKNTHYSLSNLYITLALILIPICCIGQTEFITTWDTGTSTNITIPTNSAYTYNYNVDWNDDGIIDQFGLTGNVTHDFGTAGIYTIRIYGTFPAIYFNNGGDRLKITSIDQWGNISWQSMSRAFYGCFNLGYTATDNPDLSSVTDMSFMFRSAITFNGQIDGWDVSNVTSMAGMFTGALAFNSPLNGWGAKTANVQSMEGMFDGASSFNQDINDWDVSSVTSMIQMFASANSFNSPLNGWGVKTGAVQNMIGMFHNAYDFNQDISNWDVSSVTDMSRMFSTANDFNQDISNWDVSNVTDMSYMFSTADYFDQNLSDWDVSSVTDMTHMFRFSNSMSVRNYDNTLIGWETQTVQPNVPLGSTNLHYCKGETARTSLMTNNGWTITGDTKCCPAGSSTLDACTSFSTVVTPGGGWASIDDADGYPLVAIDAPAGVDLGTVTLELRPNSAIEVQNNIDENSLKLLPRYFHISSSNYSENSSFPDNVNLRFYFTDAELDAMNLADLGTNGVTNHHPTNIDFTHYSGSDQNCDFTDNNSNGNVELITSPTYVNNSCGGYTLELSVSHFSEFIPHEPSGSPLPVELLEFTGNNKDETNLLHWTTASEKNNAGFEIERSINSFDFFEKIGFVEGNGNTAIENEYTFVDKSLENGIHYYRLKQIDFDGTYEYSEVIQILVKAKELTLGKIYPNPSRNQKVTIDYVSNKTSNISYRIVDITGKIIQQREAFIEKGNHSLSLDFSLLEKGMYLIQIDTDEDTINRKVMID